MKAKRVEKLPMPAGTLLTVNWARMIGKRMVIRTERSGTHGPEEAILLEISPSGEYLKFKTLRDTSYAYYWISQRAVFDAECLPDVPEGGAA